MQLVYNIFREDILAKKIDFEKDNIMVAIMNSEHVSISFNRAWSDVCHNEVKGEGYEAGGKALENMSIARKNNKIYIDGDDVIWNSAKFTARYVVLYFAKSKRLIGSVSFPCGCVTPTGGLFAVQWHRDGIIVEDNPDQPPQYFTHYLKKGACVD